MKYNGVIENKLRIIEEKLESVRSWNIGSFEQFSQSDLLQNAVERVLQVAVEVMIDISERILAIEKVSPMHSAADNMVRLQKMNIIRNFPEYADMVKFRNLIVHRYEKINPEIVYAILKNKLKYFEEFIRDIRNS